MAESPRKRFREEGKEETGEEDVTKRQRSLNHILSLLESDEEEPTEDLSPLITTLQQELVSSSAEPNPVGPTISGHVDDPTAIPTHSLVEGEEEEMIRQLLEASNDELGIPHVEKNQKENGVGESGGVFGYDGFWEIEDEAANYYTLLQSELFM
ncbi:uncharacterized protein LOC143848510 [Tasmannia lanceolata]|uniref:uncharacterized protein LOC143848510 n=1 Tax=Tasmannia lanceolata TaxID=3420 RepID=UPI004062CDF1